jgi:serine/threonine protein kinase
MSASAQLIESILAAAVELSSEPERRRFVADACTGDADMQRRVEELIEHHFCAGSFLEPGAVVRMDAVNEPIREQPGNMIGPYKLLEQIGEGGMGVVFMAEQQEPIRRKVALKVIKPGMDTRQVIARFEAERQALALMDHPNIARVLDAGTVGSGRSALDSEKSTLPTHSRPYFVMELVRGTPITEYCDKDQLMLCERLELVIHVCQAVQHAHQKGIIHRDLKPSNVLVTLQDGTPLVKVIDFGIAKALGQHLTDKTLFTGFAQMIGTPLYMSPEQAALSNVDVDTRSDIYSLGVLLYELLTGTTPLSCERLKEVGYDEMRRLIREEEAPRPSTRISTLGQAAATISTQRRTDPRRLSRLFRGEMDWIVMKALEKDRNRRYETASAFAADIERYMHDQPVLACPPSALYRVRKFVRRNRRALAVVGLFLFFIAILGGGGGWVVRDRAAREQQLARDREARRDAANQRAVDALNRVPRLVTEDKWSDAIGIVEQTEAILISSGDSADISNQTAQLRLAIETAQSLENARITMTGSKQDRLFDWAAGDAAFGKLAEKTQMSTADDK